MVGNMRDCEPGLQASIWLSIAESSPFKDQQLKGFERALGILRNEDSPELVETLLSYAKWVLQQGYGFDKVKVTLEEAEKLAKKYMQKGWENQDPDSGDEEFEMDEQKWKENPESRRQIESQRSMLSYKENINENSLSIIEENFQKSIFQFDSASPAVLNESCHNEMDYNQRIKHETWILESSEKNVKIFEQLFRLHSMKAMIVDDFKSQLMHLHLAGVYMKWALEFTFERYIQLLRDKMEQPGSLTQDESVLESNDMENVQKVLNKSKKSSNTKSTIGDNKKSEDSKSIKKESDSNRYKYCFLAFYF